jgi:hypothetical protein
MRNKHNYDAKVAILVEIERHRAEMTAIKDEALTAGVSEAEFMAAGLEIIADLGGVAVFSNAAPKKLNS